MRACEYEQNAQKIFIVEVGADGKQIEEKRREEKYPTFTTSQ